MKKAIVIGASSGIGYELAKVFAQNGFVQNRDSGNLVAISHDIC